MHIRAESEARRAAPACSASEPGDGPRLRHPADLSPGVPTYAARVRALLLAALLGASPALAAPAPWVVLPIRGEKPPPRDPTLLRLSKELAEALQAQVGTEVRVAARELRDEACPGRDGRCPRDVALHAAGDRVLSAVLEPGLTKLELHVYGREGLEKSATIACKWAEGFAACELERLAELIAKREASAERKESTDEIGKRFAKLGPGLQGCKKKGWGKATPEGRALEMSVRFDVGGGRVKNVRVMPAGFDTVPAYACMARVVESMKLPKGHGAAEGLRFPIPSL